MVQTRKAQNVAPEVDAEATAVTEAEIEEGSNLQGGPVYRRPLLPEDIPPLFVTIPEETVAKAHECIAKYGITGSHRLSDVSSKLHMETFQERQLPLNKNTTVYIAQVCCPTSPAFPPLKPCFCRLVVFSPTF